MKGFNEKLTEIVEGIGYETMQTQKMRLMETRDPIVIFGAGAAGTVCYNKVLEWNRNSEIVYCDNNKRNFYNGTEIISYNTLIADQKYAHSLIIIAVGAKYFPEIHNQLRESNVSAGRMVYRDYVCDKVSQSYIVENEVHLKALYNKLGDDLSKEIFWKKVENSLYCRINMDDVFVEGAEQYFDSCVRLTDEEVFVDCGGYTGDTALTFINQTNNKFSHIYSLEPDANNFNNMQKNLEPYRNITIINKGLWDQDAVLRFNAGGGVASNVSHTGEIEISVTSIDTLLETGHIPTFIKMDIEGSECNALRGAKNTIEKYKPKLAICIYHKPTDIVEIPALIEKLNPSYTSYYLRQYEPGYSGSETVLYAI